MSPTPRPAGPCGRRRALALLAGAAGAGLLRPARAGAPLRFGLTPVLLDDDAGLLAALGAYLGDSTGREVELVKRRSYQEITVLLLAGRLDAAWICGYPYVQFRDRLALVAVPVWNGAPLYRSYVIVGRDSPPSDFDDLRGTIHAFSDPDSNSGYLVTTALLRRRGEDPGRFFRHVFFTYGHRNVIRAVGRGLADGGSVDGYVFEVLRRTDPALVDACRVLRRSELFGFPPVVCRRELAGSADVEALRQALLAMPQAPPGRHVLRLLGLDGFTTRGPELFDSIAANARLVARAA
jgi:phosphonate transport system substrate-binding protein